MLTVIAAMDLELAPLRRALESRRGVPRVGPDRFQEGGGLDVELQVIGVGRKQAIARVKELVSSRHRPSGPEDGSGQQLLLLGFAGAVNPALRPGELSLPARHYWASGDGALSSPPSLTPVPTCRDTPSPSLMERGSGGQAAGGREDFLEADEDMWRQAEAAAAGAGLAVARGSSLTLDYVAATPEVKVALRQKYPVDVVNMEDYWVAEAARDAGVPFLSVRAVLDSAHHSLPSYLMGLTEHRATAVLGTVGIPWRWATLWRLAQRTRRARRTLTRFALSYIHYERLASTATGDRRARPFAGDVPREAQVG